MPTVKKSSGEFETWQNPNRHPIYLMVTERNGAKVDRVVRPGAKVEIRASDRRDLQARKLDPKKDPFTNGKLVPVQLIDDPEEFELLANNPNVVEDSEIEAYVKGKIAALRDFLSEVENPLIVRRALDIAGETDAVPNKVKAIQARLEELEPPEEPTSLADDAGPDGITVVDL